MIGLRLPLSALRGWHLNLARALTAQGYGVSVAFAAGSPALPGLELLRYVESRLYSRRAFEGADPCAVVERADFAPFAEAAAAPQIMLDCTGANAAGGDRPTLQPCFDGSLSEAQLAGALIAGRPPHIGWRRACDGALLAGGEVAIVSPHILTQGLSDCLSRLISLAGKALKLVRQPALMALYALPPAGGATGSLSGFALSSIAAQVQRRLTALLAAGPQWMVGWRASTFADSLTGSGRLQAGTIRWMPGDEARYYADPFPFEHEGRRFIFVEELPYATGRGLISLIELDEALAPVGVRPVLEQPVHMSYPGVFRHDGQVFMIPETVERRRIELYRADPFPDRWVLHAVLVEDVHAADPTLFAHGGRLWLSAATGDHGATDRDSMSLYHAGRLEGPWTPHPLNPVVVDVYGARPAGWVARGAGGLIRPAQDCSSGYGVGLSLRRIDELSCDSYAETELMRIPPPESWKASGFHTVNWQAGIETIDAVR